MKRLLQKMTLPVMLFALLWAFSLPTAISQTEKPTKSITADCDITSLPFNEGFTSGVFPSCWGKISTFPAAPSISSTSPHKDPYTIMLMVTGDATNYCYLITPYIDKNISLLRINFAFSGNLPGKLDVGVMTDPTNKDSFTLVENIAFPVGTTPYEYSVSFSDYIGNGKYIAFKLTPTTQTMASGFLDNINIDEYIADCEEVSNLSINNVGERTAVLTWQPSESTPYEYEVLVTNTATGDTVINATTEESQMILTGLSILTNYTAKVRSVCTSVDMSPWRSVDFKTLAMTACTKPNYSKVSKIRANQATLSWIEDGSANRYVVEYRAVGDTQWERDTISEPSGIVEYVLTGLEPNTEYNVRLITLCQNGNSSAAVPVDFRTLCLPLTTLPYIEHFDNILGGTTANGLLPSCWHSNKSNTTNRPFVDWQGSATATNSKSRFGALNLHVSTTTTNIANLPSFDIDGLSISDLQVDFWSRNSDNLLRGVFTLGVIDDIEDETTFTPVDTIVFTAANTWENSSIPLSGYTGNGSHIAFKWSGGANSYLYIDDLYIDVISTCSKPTSLAVESVTATSVTCSWEAPLSTEMQIVCTPIGTTPDWINAITVSSNPITYNGLSPMTQYEVYLKTICYEDDVISSIPIIATFWTGCADITEDMLPYTETFDRYGLNKLPSCWSSGSSSSPVTANTYSSAPASLAFPYTNSMVEGVTGKLDMNVSTLQIDFKLRVPSLNESITVGVMSDPAEPTSFVAIDEIYGKTVNTWESHTVYFNKYEDSGKYIAFRMGQGTVPYTIYLDDLVISKSNLCFMPDRLSVIDIQADEVTISWRENGNATNWEVIYGPVGFNPENSSAGTTINTSDNPLIISSLAENTVADFYVRAVCDENSHSDWSSSGTFHTPKAVATLPYVCNFEDPAENSNWVLINGTQTNKWYIGGATAFDGTKSLYVSDNNGVNHHYNILTPSFVYAIRSFNITKADTYEMLFDWKSNGSHIQDLMKIFLVPSTIVLKAGDNNGMNNNNTPPSEWIEITENPLSNVNIWTSSASMEFTVATPGLYNLVILWKNVDTRYGMQSPGAIDNIVIQSLSCPQPTNLSVLSINGTTADIIWTETGSTTQWDIEYGKAGFTLGTGAQATAFDTPTFTLTDLEPFEEYDVYVRGVCSGEENSSWSSKLTFQAECPTPTALTVTDITMNTAIISWDAGVVSEWLVDYRRTGTGNYSTAVSVTSPIHVLSGLTPNTNYTVRVRTFCISTNISYEVITNFQTLVFSDSNTCTITPAAGANGSIAPNTPVSVNKGRNATFLFTPDDGYEVAAVQVDGIAVSIPADADRYTFENIQKSATIYVTFKVIGAIDTFLINATAGAHGTIDPRGSVKVVAGDSQTFTFTPDEGYVIKLVQVDGVTIENTPSSYTFSDVLANKTIHVEFDVTAVAKYELDHCVSIYPNPVSKQLTVKLSTDFEQMEITNLLGQVIYTDVVNGQEFTVDVNDYRSGVYFIRLSGKQGVATKKFIKE